MCLRGLHRFMCVYSTFKTFTLFKSLIDYFSLFLVIIDACVIPYKKDNLIFFKMIPYLLWFSHQEKGSISKYGIRSQLKSCKMKTMQWSWIVHKEHVLLCGVMYFFSSWSAHQQHEDVVPGGGAGTWVVHPILSPGHVTEINEHWWTIHVTISMKIYAN